MMQQGICSQCKVNFTYNNQDRSGKFCSKKCHYDSKNEQAICVHCQQSFNRTIKGGRKTCSKDCWAGQKGLRSKNPKVRELCEFLRARSGGQFSVEEVLQSPLMKIEPSENKTLIEQATIRLKAYAMNIIKMLKLDRK